MSRLIIKNLPSYVTPEKLKTHLSQRDGPGGTLTDVKVARKSDGTSRRFAFVGYKTEEEAAKVAKWFDKTFFDSTRIVVQTVEVRPYSLQIPMFARLTLYARKVRRTLQRLVLINDLERILPPTQRESLKVRIQATRPPTRNLDMKSRLQTKKSKNLKNS